jgi:hypothetical protein
MHRPLIFVALAALTACSSGGGAGTPDGGASTSACTTAVASKGCFGTCDSCTLLTQDQAGAGVDVTLNAGDNGGDPHSCDWEHLDTSGIPDVQVIVESNINAKTFDDICHPSNHGSNDAGITVTALSGVGDDACYVQLQGLGGPDLTVLKGCWAYTISIAGPTGQFSDTTIEADEKRLASIMLPAL